MSGYQQSLINFYEHNEFKAIERAILEEDIIFTSLDNLVGKFYIPSMMPSVDISEGVKLQTNGKYQTSNYVCLTIPAYIVMQFILPSLTNINTTDTTINLEFSKNTEYTIPKGTEFLIEFIGGFMAIDKTCIVGVLPS